ncbi:MAG: heparinase II/III family protein [Firmicutes bacterium]|nr:heparinase II/III family protein [Bacillota bacterium]
MATKKQYLNYIEKAVEQGRTRYNEDLEKWKNNFDPNYVFGYCSPAHIPIQAHIEGFMYSLNGKEEHAIWAKKCLLEVEGLKKIYPEEKIKQHPEYQKGLPSVEPAFSLQPYIYGYLYIRKSGILNNYEKLQIENSIKSSINPIFHFPEWGAHNRSMLRVWSLALAVKALGKNQDTEEWQKLADYLAEETWGKWSIEDAELYIALWFIASIHYAELINKEHEYFSMPQTRYYFDYITRLLTSYGQIPDFGDSHFNSNWYIWLACLEKGASVYNCGYMKYAAQKIWEFGLSQNNSNEYSSGIANYLAYAYQWADDTVKPAKPDWKSGEVLEELVGKKIAFRNGWDDSSTYLLLNYRDEGYYGYIPRKYLRTTLSVRAEKMHHGHSDENSIVFLVKDKNILLNDGGYRENLPNGKYRADIYHNRLVFREGLKNESTSLYDFVHDEGYYKKVVTEKLHFQDFGRLCISRTRLYNTLPHLIWDRIITYLENEDVFIVIDWIYSKFKGDMTVANLWHTGKILEQRENAFDTCIPYIYRYPGDINPIRNKDNFSLCIEFLDNGRDKKVEFNTIKRHYGNGVMISQYNSREYKERETDCFVTVLTPHETSADMGKITGKAVVEWISENKDAILLTYRGKSTVYLTYKLDLEKGIMADENEYPRYTWESGKINYEKVVTDADFSYIDELDNKVKYGFINGSGIEFAGKGLYRTPDFTTYKFGTDVANATNHKWRVWTGEENRPKK